jgi:hypothetical protein
MSGAGALVELSAGTTVGDAGTCIVLGADVLVPVAGLALVMLPLSSAPDGEDGDEDPLPSFAHETDASAAAATTRVLVSMIILMAFTPT